MPVNTDIYKIEGAIEACWKSILEAEELDASTSREAGNLVTPRVTVRFSLGQATGRMKAEGVNKRFDTWSGTLEFTVTTNRTENSGSHDEYIAAVRDAAARWQELVTSTNLPLHSLGNVQDLGSSRGLNGADGEDETTIAYSCAVSVRSSAWA